MKKTLIAVLGAIALTACCQRTYYTGGVKYTQDGADCIYRFAEDGGMFARAADKQFREDKKIVYRDTNCKEMYHRDTADAPKHPERKILTDNSETSAASAVYPAPKPRHVAEFTDEASYYYVKKTKAAPRTSIRKLVAVSAKGPLIIEIQK